MIDSYQGPDSNQHPLKSLSQITVRFKGYSQIVILSKFSDLWLIYWLGLGHTSVTSLDVNLRMWEIAIDLRIWRWFENLKKDIDLIIWNQRLSRACIVHLVTMLIYVLRWRPSWISDWHKKQKICREPSNDHSWAVWFQLS